MDEAARAKHKALTDHLAEDPKAVSTLDSIQEWRDAEINAINTSTRGLRWVAGTAIVLSVVAICITASFGILSLLTQADTHHQGTVTRNKVDNVLILAQGAICTGAPQTAGCPSPKPGAVAAAQSAQTQTVNSILQGQINSSKAACEAAAIQLSITTGVPASALASPCDAIK